MTTPPNYPVDANWNAPFPPPPTPNGRRRNAIVIALVSAVVVIACGVTLLLTLTGSSKNKTFTLNGTVTVTCSDTYGSSISAQACASGYSDLHAGAQVEIFNEKQELLATGTLLAGAGPTASTGEYSSISVVTVYAFVVSNVPRGAKQYGVHVGNTNRGIIWKTEDEAARDGFALSIGGS